MSTEGINLFVAGGADEIELLLAELRAIPGLEELTPKYSQSADQPFTRMLVRIKKEIIAFGVEGIDPASRTSPKLPARTLKQWLDEGRPVTLLDTRNDYEVKLGTFKNATPIGIQNFRQFPEAVRQLPEEWKEQPIVMFCTGGIRCEKAGPFMEREGFRSIFQLEGGILKYFEECGGEHYDGECFVFDQRVGVDPALQETDSAQCYACQTPLDADDQRDPRFVAGQSCPYCFKDDRERARAILAERRAAIRQFATPLPGSVPCDNRRPICISAPFDRRPLLDVLDAMFPQVGRSHWQNEFALQRLLDEGDRAAQPDRIVRAGERYFRLIPANIEPDVNAEIEILYEDEALIVVNKPAPLPMHPSGRFHRNTLQHILDHVYAPFQPRPVHRLDANTSGVLVCARTRRFARLMQPQFVRGEVEKIYLARVIGHPPEDAFLCDAPISVEPGELGSRETDAEEGRDALTAFLVRERLPDGTALLEARPRTGRTNQIRVHLWDRGYPICGDPAYLPERKLGSAMTLPIGAPPLCLHAWRLSLVHPITQKQMLYEAETPAWSLGHGSREHGS